MIDLIDDWTADRCGGMALVPAAVLTAVLLARRKETQRRQPVAMSDSHPRLADTWKINAVADAWVMEHEKDDIPSNFVLRIENRVVRDIGGGEVMETRWRPPTKAEVREIVRRYHEAQAEVPRFKAIEFERPLHAGASNDYVDPDGAVAETVEAA
jgi:hypothetical protein